MFTSSRKAVADQSEHHSDEYQDMALNEPAQDTDDSAQPGTLQNISDRLEQIEFVFAERTDVIMDLAVNVQVLSDRIEKIGRDVERHAETSGQNDTLDSKLEALSVDLKAALAVDDASEEAGSNGPDFAEHAEKLETMLEEVTRQVSDLSAQQSRFDEIIQKQDQIRSALEQAPNPNEGMSEKVDASIDAAVQSIMSRLEAIEKRPDPVVDHSLQRRNLSQFSEVFSKIAARLEASIEAMEARPEPEQNSVPLEDAPEPVSSDEVIPGLERLEASLAELSELVRAQEPPASEPSHAPPSEDAQERLDALAKQIAALPDHLADGSQPQREALARFNVSSTAFMRRLECLVATLAADHARTRDMLKEQIGGSNPEIGRMADGLIGIATKLAEAHNQAPSTGQNSQTE